MESDSSIKNGKRIEIFNIGSTTALESLNNCSGINFTESSPQSIIL